MIHIKRFNEDVINQITPSVKSNYHKVLDEPKGNKSRSSYLMMYNNFIIKDIISTIDLCVKNGVSKKDLIHLEYEIPSFRLLFNLYKNKNDITDIKDIDVSSFKEIIKKLYYLNKNKFIDKNIANNNCECFYCGKILSKKEITIDHYIPISKGGDLFNSDNLKICCKLCNTIKSNYDINEFKILFNSYNECLKKLKSLEFKSKDDIMNFLKNELKDNIYKNEIITLLLKNNLSKK